MNRVKLALLLALPTVSFAACLSTTPANITLPQLAQTLQTDPSEVKTQAFHQITLVTKTFPADGQVHYYLITKNGCLLDATPDPRTLSSTLQNQYGAQSWVIVADKAPQITHHGRSVKSTVEIRQGCLACPTLGTAKIHFEFSSDGQLAKTEVKYHPQNTAYHN